MGLSEVLYSKPYEISSFSRSLKEALLVEVDEARGANTAFKPGLAVVQVCFTSILPLKPRYFSSKSVFF